MTPETAKDWAPKQGERNRGPIHLKQRERDRGPIRAECLAFRPHLHGEPLLETASMRDLGDGEGGYVADALGRTMLLPTDVIELKNMRM